MAAVRGGYTVPVVPGKIKEKIATGVLMAKWDFDTKWTVKPLVVL